MKKFYKEESRYVLHVLQTKVMAYCSTKYSFNECIEVDTQESFRTIFCDCEPVINSRLITYSSDNPNDFIRLKTNFLW